MVRKNPTYLKRQCLVGGKRRTLEQLCGVVAVKASEQFPVTEPKEDRIRDQWRTFEQAGYRFVDMGTVINSELHPVFIHQTLLMLGTRRLVAKLKPDLKPSQTHNALSICGLKVIRELKFGPNLFEVELAETADPIEFAERLSGTEDFLYLEPQFIQCVSPR